MVIQTNQYVLTVSIPESQLSGYTQVFSNLEDAKRVAEREHRSGNKTKLKHRTVTLGNWEVIEL